MLSQRNYGCRISEFKIYETPVVVLENELLRIGVLAGKGADIYEFLDKRTDTDFMFRERRGLDRLNGFIPSVATAQGPFWDYMIGGWFELFPNASNASHSQGAQIGQHGEVYLQPWDWKIIEDSPECISVEFSVRTMRTPFLLKRTMTLRSNSGVLEMKESVTNDSACRAEFLWGHHVTFGEAFLNENCVIDLPECKVVNPAPYDSPASRLRPDCPGNWYDMEGKDGSRIDQSKVLGRDAGVSEMLFAIEMQESWFAINDRVKKSGMAVSWDGDMYRSLWIWEEFCASAGWPLYSDTYALALEPQVSDVPMLENSSAVGKSVWLEAKQSISTWITVSVFHDERKVVHVDPDGTIKFS